MQQWAHHTISLNNLWTCMYARTSPKATNAATQQFRLQLTYVRNMTWNKNTVPVLQRCHWMGQWEVFLPGLSPNRTQQRPGRWCCWAALPSSAQRWTAPPVQRWGQNPLTGLTSLALMYVCMYVLYMYTYYLMYVQIAITVIDIDTCGTLMVSS